MHEKFDIGTVPNGPDKKESNNNKEHVRMQKKSCYLNHCLYYTYDNALNSYIHKNFSKQYVY